MMIDVVMIRVPTRSPGIYLKGDNTPVEDTRLFGLKP